MMSTWNLDEQRREGEEEDDRHAPEVKVARCAYFRRHRRRVVDAHFERLLV